MAFKIVYGAGQTLSRSSESKFGSGYGFLAMHREDSVKALAFEVLEKRLMGNSYDFECGDEWIPEGSDTRELIPISSFFHCRDWYVLSRVRPIPESRGRMYFLAEFLLIDENEALHLALGSKEEGRPQISPADILASQSEELWFSREMWEQRGTWYSDPIDLVRIFSSEHEAAQVRDASEWYSQHRGAFNHKECVWNCDRKLDGNLPVHVLRSMAVTQRTFFETYHSRLTESFSPGVRGFFDLAWNRITFTNFYLNPSTGLNIHFGEKESELPYTWTAAWQRVPSQSELLENPNQIQLGAGSEFDEEKLVELGLINPAPVTPDPSAASATGDEKPILLNESDVGIGNSHEPERTVKGFDISRLSWLWKNKKVTAAIGAVVILGILGSISWSKFQESKQVASVVAGLEKARKDDRLGADELARELAKIDQKHWERKNVESFVLANTQATKLKSHFDAIAGVPPSSVGVKEFSVDPIPPDRDLFNRLNFVWSVAVNYQGLLKKPPVEKADNLEKTRSLLKQWIEEEDEIETSFRKLWDTSTWKNYQQAIHGRFVHRISTLIQSEENQKNREAETSDLETSDPDREFRQKLQEFVISYSDGDNKIFTDLVSRVTALTSAPVAVTEDGDKPEVTVESPPEMPEETPAGAGGPIVSANLVRAGEDRFFSYPADRGTRVLSVPKEQAALKLADAVWVEGELRVPLYPLEGIEQFPEIKKGGSNVTAGDEKLGEVHTTDTSRFKFEGEAGVSVFLVEKSPDKFDYILFLRKEQASSINIGKFLNAKAGKKIKPGISVSAANASLQVEHKRIGTGRMALSSLGDALQSPEKLGLQIASEVKDLEAEKPADTGGGITKADADAFKKWFWGEGDAGNAIHETFLQGIAFWTEETKTVKQNNKQVEVTLYPPVTIDDPSTDVGLFYKDLKSPKLYLAGSNQSYDFPANRSVSGALASYLHFLCEAIDAEKKYFPNLNGAEFAPDRILKANSNLNQVRKELLDMDNKDGFKDPISSKKLDKEEKLKHDNNKQLRANWKAFYDDLGSIIKFANEADKAGPVGPEGKPDYIKRIEETLAKVPAASAAKPDAGKKDEFKEKLESGDLSELKFRLIVK